MTSRRALLGTGVLVAAGAGLAGCSWTRTPQARATGGPSAVEAASGTATVALLMIVRHAEKPPAQGAPFGALPGGEPDPKSLTTTGWSRAGALVALFDPRGEAGPLDLRPGLARPEALVAADPDGASKRPFQTVTPLASRLGLTPDISYAKGDEAKLARSLRTITSPTLVAWEHEAIPAILSNLGKVAPQPPSSWPDSRFDLVWCLTRTAAASWTFSQVPQLLLAGDSASPA